MTIAMGIVTGTGVVLAADTQETDGYFKENVLKVTSAMTHSQLHSPVRSAMGITGAGAAIHLDSVNERLIKMFQAKQCRDIDSLETEIQEVFYKFYIRHVAKIAKYGLDRDFRLIIGAQVEGEPALWTTEATVIKRVHAVEAVGTGAPFAKMALESKLIATNIHSAIVLSVLGVTRAKEYDHYSGKGTFVVCLRDNASHYIPGYRLDVVERLLRKYAGVEHSMFQYVLDPQLLQDEHSQKISQWVREIRTELDQARFGWTKFD